MKSNSILLRQWRDEDLNSFAEMNADPEVMRFLPKPLTRTESEEFMARLRARIAERGWGLWAVEVEGGCAGFTGLAIPVFSAQFTPCVEIGWRLRREYWGLGIAYSAALAAQAFAFDNLKLSELVSFTTAENARSRRLMERLGFSRKVQDDFLHPSLAPDNPLRPHVLYRKSAVVVRAQSCSSCPITASGCGTPSRHAPSPFGTEHIADVLIAGFALRFQGVITRNETNFRSVAPQLTVITPAAQLGA